MSEKKELALSVDTHARDFGKLCSVFEEGKKIDLGDLPEIPTLDSPQGSLANYIVHAVAAQAEAVLDTIFQPLIETEDAPISLIEEARSHIRDALGGDGIFVLLVDEHVRTTFSSEGSVRSGVLVLAATRKIDHASAEAILLSLGLCLREARIFCERLLQMLEMKMTEGKNTLAMTESVRRERFARLEMLCTIPEDAKKTYEKAEIDSHHEALSTIDQKTLPRIRTRLNRKEQLRKLALELFTFAGVGEGRPLELGLKAFLARFQYIVKLDQVKEMIDEDSVLAQQLQKINEGVSIDSALEVNLQVKSATLEALPQKDFRSRSEQVLRRGPFLSRYVLASALIAAGGVAGASWLLKKNETEGSKEQASSQSLGSSRMLRYRTSAAREYRGAKSASDLPPHVQGVYDQIYERTRKQPFVIHVQEFHPSPDEEARVIFNLLPFEPLSHVVGIDFRFAVPQTERSGDLPSLESLSYYRPGVPQPMVSVRLSDLQQVIAAGGGLAAVVETDFTGEEGRSISFFIEGVALQMNDALSKKLGFGKAPQMEIKE